MSLGKAIPKIDGLEKISGKAVYVDDMSRPGMLHAAFLRSPHPHARILSIDTGPALVMEGVHAVLTGADLPINYGVIPVSQDETALAVGKVRFVGEEVAVVAAVDRETAISAAQAIQVEYELLENVFTIEDALNPDKPLLHEGRRKASNVLRRVFQKYGDPEAGFAEADVILEEDYFYPGSTHVPLETQGALAEVDGKGKLTLYSSTQIPHYLQRALARILEMPSKEVRVIKPHVGAGYGGKSDPFANEICAAALAIRTGRPVKCILNREEVFYTHRGRHPTRMSLKMGITKSGRITACDFKAVSPGGAYASFGVVTAYYFGVFLALPYKLDSFQFEAKRLYTNHPPCGPKRGHGAIQPRFALELHLDKLAHAIGMDPAELRRINAVEANTETCNGLRITSVALVECIDRVKAASDYDAKKGHLPPNRGIGLAASAYMCGALHPIYQNDMPQSAVQVLVDRSGSVAIYSGTADIGQGSNHMLAALVGESLGIEAAQCVVLEGDTALTPVDLGAYSSRVTFMAGNAAVDAAEILADRIRAAVATKWDCAPEEVRLKDGLAVHQSDANRSLPFEEAAVLAEAAEGTLSAVGHYTPPKIGSRFRRQSVGPSPAYSFTAQVAEVEVDPETGITRIHKIWCAHDCGKAINPLVVEGQIEGSVYMGVGEAMAEEQAFQEQGLHRAPSILEYKIPTVHDTPEIISLLVESNDPEGPHGAKEAGEGPQLATVPAIGIAIHDACGIWLNEAPFTPERLLKAIERKARADAKAAK
jgi:4-hydroxybenzoyl-CoA reductase alpha subunit